MQRAGKGQQIALQGPPVRPNATDIFDAQIVQHGQGADSIGVAGTLLPQTLEFAVRAPVVFLLRRWDACDRPYPPLARVIGAS
jgi:hypothetical protein